MIRKTLSVLTCLLLIVGCDQSSIQNTQEEPIGAQLEQNLPFQATSASHLDSDAPAAQKLRSFLNRSGNISTQDIYWRKLKVINMKVDGYESEVSAVVALIQKKNSPNISVFSTEGKLKEYPVEHSQLVYLPSLDKSFTTAWHRTGDPESEKWSGFARFVTPDERFTYEVKNGLPIRKVDQRISIRKDKEKECLKGPDCTTGDCYKTAKDACDSDGGCKLLCDAIDIATFPVGGLCTVSIATACLYLNA